MADDSPLLQAVISLHPCHVLDVGCGCGAFTATFSPHCESIVAIDSSRALVERCRRENSKSNISFNHMDGMNIQFPDRSFDLVLERATLHHIADWEKVLDEMVRVSSRYVLIEEPVDDPRSEAKRNAIATQKVLLELQNEVSYTHYEHLSVEALTEYFRKKEIATRVQIVRSDELLDFASFFEIFAFFVEKSARKDYWLARLDELKAEYGCRKTCESDTILITVEK